jgi:hypothetical protein
MDIRLCQPNDHLVRQNQMVISILQTPRSVSTDGAGFGHAEAR